LSFAAATSFGTRIGVQRWIRMKELLANKRKLRAILSHRLHGFYELLKAYFAKDAEEFLNRAEQANRD
jgi:hypothetical protein